MHIIAVAVPVPLRQTFSYCHDSPLVAGLRVKVPFGGRELMGVVVGEVPSNSAININALKSIVQVLDDAPLFDDVFIALVKWLAGYYHHPIGEVWATVLPSKLRKGAVLESKIPVYQLVNAQRLTEDLAELRGKQQKQCLLMVQASATAESELKRKFSPSVINALCTKALIAKTYKNLEQETHWQQFALHQERPVASSEQAVAIAAVNQAQRTYTPFLLDGVTGSGKTEVYLQVIEPILRDGKQVLILVPEIGLTPQTVSRFQQRFGIEVGVLHSQMTDHARMLIWQRARQGNLGIVIGTRSAIFTPLKALGMIIVDEEHDESFKQQDGLRYHARDFAVKRAHAEQVPLILGSATVSLESLKNALEQRYTHLTLHSRAGGASHTQLKVLDSRDQPLHAGIAQGLVSIIRAHLEQGNQVLVFLNRRGFAPAVLCHHCGHTVECKSCERPYTYHKSTGRLQCHHCGSSRRMPTHCSHCNSTEIQTSGVGTEQLEQELGRLFPDTQQVRIDSDAIKGKDKLVERLAEINARKYQLLVGTQILSKGHHFPHVTLAVVLDCDGALFSADFRAAEKLAQLITQLAGRAGRANKPGEMWLQTDNPDHPLLQDLIHNGFSHFARQVLVERRHALLPPFSRQAIFRAEANDTDDAIAFLQHLRQRYAASQWAQYGQMIGPIPCLIEKRQGRYRFMLILQSEQRAMLHPWVNESLNELGNLPNSRRVRWSLDIDPVDFN